MINSIKLNGYRGFSNFAMSGLGRINLLVGKNNSGKTSILEGLLLLASSSDPLVLWKVLARRGEQSMTEATPNRGQQAELDIGHLFHGHEIKVGATLSITTQNQMPGRAISYKIDEAKQEESPILFQQLSVLGEEPAASRLALKISGHPVATIPPIPLSKQMGIRQETLQQLSGMVRANGTASIPQYISTDSLNVAELLQLWNSIVLTPEEDRTVKALQLLEPNIERIATVNMGPIFYGGFVQRGGFAVRMKGIGTRLPIGSFGDGMWRILALAVALSRAKDNILLIDEIDTGLHYTVMADMWKLINSASELFNVQVFATTHSHDCIHSLASICRDIEDSQSNITIQRIESNATSAVPFSESQIKIAADRDLEIR